MAPFGVPNPCPKNDTPKGAHWHSYVGVPTRHPHVKVPRCTLRGAIMALSRKGATRHPETWHLRHPHMVTVRVIIADK